MRKCLIVSRWREFAATLDGLLTIVKRNAAMSPNWILTKDADSQPITTAGMSIGAAKDLVPDEAVAVGTFDYYSILNGSYIK